MHQLFKLVFLCHLSAYLFVKIGDCIDICVHDGLFRNACHIDRVKNVPVIFIQEIYANRERNILAVAAFLDTIKQIVDPLVKVFGRGIIPQGYKNIASPARGHFAGR